VDRARIIDELVKRDRALRAGRPAPVPATSNVIHVGSMHASTIQQSTHRSSARIDFKSKEEDLRSLLNDIKTSVDQISLSAAAKAQLDADLSTVETQLSSPSPKPSIVIECLTSAKSILESAVGSLIASGLGARIAGILG
jgi:hypothetical protein